METLISLTVVAAPLYLPSCIILALHTAKTLRVTAGINQLREEKASKARLLLLHHAKRDPVNETGTEGNCGLQPRRIHICAGSAGVQAARQVLGYDKLKAEPALPCRGVVAAIKTSLPPDIVSNSNEDYKGKLRDH